VATQSVPAERRSPDDVRRRFAELLAASSRGEPEAARLAWRMADVLGAQIASFVHLIQPALIVLGGALAGIPLEVFDRIEAAVRQRLPSLLDNNLIIRPAHVVGDDATAVGATRVFVHRLLYEEAVPLAPR
jgi:predicted NBD/HSP70 family sugar kinase